MFGEAATPLVSPWYQSPGEDAIHQPGCSSACDKFSLPASHHITLHPAPDDHLLPQGS